MQYGTYEVAPTYEGTVIESAPSTIAPPAQPSPAAPGLPGAPGSSAKPDGEAAKPAASLGTYTSNKLASIIRSARIDEIHLVVNMPENAKLLVNGNETTSTGNSRHFVSRDLRPEESYRFELKALFTDEAGNEVRKTKTLVLSAGSADEVTFDLDEAKQPVETVLTLNVPTGAKVVLGENETKTEGSSRIYRTKHLREGEAWDDYRIEVTYQGETKERVIRLIGGDQVELTFQFDDANSDRLAAN